MMMIWALGRHSYSAPIYKMTGAVRPGKSSDGWTPEAEEVLVWATYGDDGR